MTNTNTPDRIWAEADKHILGCGKWRTAQDNAPWGTQYLLSTPAREQADALLATLTKVRDACLVDDPHGLTVETEVTISYELFAEMQDAIDKAKGEA